MTGDRQRRVKELFQAAESKVESGFVSEDQS